MATLTVWRFEEPSGADDAASGLERLEAVDMITIHDAAVVRWDKTARRPTTRQLRQDHRGGALPGSFWGLLFGTMFLMPVVGAVVGAAIGGTKKALSDAGIDDAFIVRVRGEIVPGASALFVLSSAANTDAVRAAFPGGKAKLIHTNLDAEQETALRKAFVAEQP